MSVLTIERTATAAREKTNDLIQDIRAGRTNHDEIVEKLLNIGSLLHRIEVGAGSVQRLLRDITDAPH